MATDTKAPVATHSPDAAIVASLADTFVVGAGALANRVRYVARIERAATKAGERVDWKALCESIKAERPDATGVSTASLSKARTAALMLTSDADGLGRALSAYRDSAISDALRIVQDAPAETRAEIVTAARAAVAALPEHAPADVIGDALAGALETGKATAREARRVAESKRADDNAARKAEREAAAAAAEQAGRDAVAGIVAEVTPDVMRSTVESTHLLDLLGAVAVALADANDLGTLEAAQAALSGMLADMPRLIEAVSAADLVDVI